MSEHVNSLTHVLGALGAVWNIRQVKLQEAHCAMFSGHAAAGCVVSVLLTPTYVLFSDILVLVMWAAWHWAGAGNPDEGGHGR